MKKIIIAALLGVTAIINADAQKVKVKWETGDLSVLSGQTNVVSAIDYSRLTVADGPEQQFLDERQKADNTEKAGAGDKFVEDWNAAKASKYINRFNDNFTKASKEKISASTVSDAAKYKIILTPRNVDLGKGRYFGTKPAEVDFAIAIVEAANPANIVARGSVDGVPGESKAPKGTRWIPGGAGAAIDVSNRVQNFDATNRVAESFELLAVTLGKQLRK